MDQVGGEPGVVAVELPLAGAVGVHLEESLRVDLRTVVVLPPRVEHAPVVGDGGEDRVHLIEAEAAQVLPVAAHGEEVAHLDPVAIHRLHAAGGAEHDVAVGEVDPFVVGDAESLGELTDRARRHRHLVEVVVVLAVRLLPREEDPVAVVPHVGIADHPVRVFEERSYAADGAVELEELEGGAGAEVTVRRGVGERLGVLPAPGDVGVLVEDEARGVGEERREALRAARGAGAEIELLPPGIATGGGGGGEGFELVAERRRRGADLLQHASDHPSFHDRVALAHEAGEGREARRFRPCFPRTQMRRAPLLPFAIEHFGEFDRVVVLVQPVVLDLLPRCTLAPFRRRSGAHDHFLFRGGGNPLDGRRSGDDITPRRAEDMFDHLEGSASAARLPVPEVDVEGVLLRAVEPDLEAHRFAGARVQGGDRGHEERGEQRLRFVARVHLDLAEVEVLAPRGVAHAQGDDVDAGSGEDVLGVVSFRRAPVGQLPTPGDDRGIRGDRARGIEAHRLVDARHRVRPGDGERPVAVFAPPRLDDPRVVVDASRVVSRLHVLARRMDADVEVREVPRRTAAPEHPDLFSLRHAAPDRQVGGDRVEVVVLPDHSLVVDDVDEDRVGQEPQHRPLDAREHVLFPLEAREVDPVGVGEHRAPRIAVAAAEVHRFVVALQPVREEAVVAQRESEARRVHDRIDGVPQRELHPLRQLGPRRRGVRLDPQLSDHRRHHVRRAPQRVLLPVDRHPHLRAPHESHHRIAFLIHRHQPHGHHALRAQREVRLLSRIEADDPLGGEPQRPRQAPPPLLRRRRPLLRLLEVMHDPLDEVERPGEAVLPVLDRDLLEGRRHPSILVTKDQAPRLVDLPRRFIGAGDAEDSPLVPQPQRPVDPPLFPAAPREAEASIRERLGREHILVLRERRARDHQQQGGEQSNQQEPGRSIHGVVHGPG